MIDLDRARQFLRVRHDGILVTLKRDGRPQLSNILYFLDDDGTVGPNSNFAKVSSTSSFGAITTATDPRIGQLALKIIF